MLKLEKRKIRFTERDITIFEFLSIYGYADLDALYMLTKNFFPCSKNTFKERLNVLTEAGYIKIGSYSMPTRDKNNSAFKFTLIEGNRAAFAGIGGRKPNIKILKSNFFHEFFIIRTLAKSKENGDIAYSEKMDEYPFSNKEIRPDVYLPSLKIGFEVEVSIKRNWLEYGKKFAVLQDHLDYARHKNKEIEIDKLIYLVQSGKDKISLIKTFDNLKSKSINKGNNFKTFLVSQTIDDHIRVLTFEEFYDRDLNLF
jgi:hypothetical protein